MRSIAQAYADGTAAAWERKMRQEAEGEARDARRRQDLADTSHSYRPDPLLLGFCVCGNRERTHDR